MPFELLQMKQNVLLHPVFALSFTAQLIYSIWVTTNADHFQKGKEERESKLREVNC